MSYARDFFLWHESCFAVVLLNEHKFSNSKATVVYHSFVALAYLSPLFGSIAADNYFGRYRIIFWISLCIGLVVIALATGGIKPCVSAFAADQKVDTRSETNSSLFSTWLSTLDLFCRCIALKAKICALINRTTTLPHWLYYAKVCTLFLPLMVCAALFDQTGSTWVIQSLQMNGRVGSLIIQPDQMVTVNSLLVIFLVPIFEVFVYPLVSKVSKVTPLRKMGLACILMCGCIACPGHVFVQRVGSSTDQFRANVLGKSLSNIKEEWPVGKYVIKSKKVSYNLDLKAEFCGYLVGLFDEDHIPELSSFPYVCNKESNGRTRVYIMLAPASVLNSTNIYLLDQNEQIKQTHQIYSGEFIDIVPSFISSTHYYFAYDNCKLRSKTRGAIHVLTLTQSNVKSSGKDYNTLLVKGNSLSILWQLPQYAMISLAEVLLLITGLSFSYSQAAPSMKSVLQAVWLLMVFFGNFIDMIIMATNIYKNAVFGFFFSAGLMAIAAGETYIINKIPAASLVIEFRKR
uniref:Uncharacterized protein n=1 Tax=Ditylenchus dipsaci TaxID=166011 RepID=A0A915DB71_9BILA